MKVLVAMSGGVDSSVAAKILKSKGFDCVGCTMKLYDDPVTDENACHTCCSESDVFDAKSVAFSLGMPYYVFNFKDGFKEKVIDKFVESYLRGSTPNPCIDCNRYMKFDKLFERMVQLNCNFVATGHYARIEKSEDGLFILKKAVDPSKDQSYVLYSMTQYQLSHTLFPLGGLKKSETRKIAEENNFINAQKPDSQDVCFVPHGDYSEIIRLYAPHAPGEGNFVDKNGKILGRHKGYYSYTVGQRKGLGVSASKRVFVTQIHPGRNEVVLGDAEDLFVNEIFVTDCNFISGSIPDKPFCCSVQTRYRGKENQAEVIPYAGGFLVRFDRPERAPTVGQAAVLYSGDVVLGGGTIAKKQ